MEMFDCAELTLDFAGRAGRAKLHVIETSARASLKFMIFAGSRVPHCSQITLREKLRLEVEVSQFQVQM